MHKDVLDWSSQKVNISCEGDIYNYKEKEEGSMVRWHRKRRLRQLGKRSSFSHCSKPSQSWPGPPMALALFPTLHVQHGSFSDTLMHLGISCHLHAYF